MLAASQKFKDFLRTSHVRELRIHLYGLSGSGGTSVAVDYGALQITRGSLDMDLMQFVMTTLSAEVGLDPFGTLSRRTEQSLAIENGFVTVEVGIQYPDQPYNPEWVLLATLRLTRFSPNASLATTRIEAMDRTVMLRDIPVLALEMDDGGYQAHLDAGWDWKAAVQAVVSYAMIGETVIVDSGVGASNLDPKTTMKGQGRDTLIDQWCELNNAFMRCAPDGRLHLSPRPSMTGTSVWDITHGENGTLVQNNEEYARENIFNGVLVEWQEPENDPPDNYRRGLAVDTNPLSPTYWDGPFGRRIKTIEDLPVHSNAEAQTKAEQHRDEILGKYFSIDITCLANPLLQLGDTIGVQAIDMPYHLRGIDHINLPLGPEATMSITTRTAPT